MLTFTSPVAVPEAILYLISPNVITFPEAVDAAATVHVLRLLSELDIGDPLIA